MDTPELQRAQVLQAAGQTQEAEQAYRALATSRTRVEREAALQALVQLYFKSGRPAEAVNALVALTGEQPDRLYFYAQLAAVLEELGRPDEAIGHYQRLLARRPDLANAHFNLALLYRKTKRYADAEAAYRQAIHLGIDGLPEVYSNLGVLYSEMHRAGEARSMYQKALELDSNYIPALFNLGGLLEESGGRQEAIGIYEKILAIDPSHRESLSRLAYAQRQTDASLLPILERSLQDSADDPIGREALYFATGKILDDLGQHKEAFVAYDAGNELGRKRNPPYQPDVVEQHIDLQIRAFSSDWLSRSATTLAARPVFICGMLRSGSTLVEQILAAHPEVTAGGELDFIPWLIGQRLMPYPQGAVDATTTQLEAFGRRYLELVDSILPGRGVVTDKRPDNFLHLGLIKAVFPKARIVYTRRSPLDNCLSIYFQQLGGNLNYATDLKSTAHYYCQHSRLMKHWAATLRDGLFTVDYDVLVQQPVETVRGLLQYLDLAWDDRCLEFWREGGAVRTASVWQVREPLHTRSSGRWRDYEPYLREVGEILAVTEG